MKKFLVLYDKPYIKERLEKFDFIHQYADFEFLFMSRASDDDRGLHLFLSLSDYDGICIVKDGEWLKGIWGNHTGKDKKSIVRVESKENTYRKWSKRKEGWVLTGTKSKTEFPQLEYTFGHEIGHALAYQYNKSTMSPLLFNILKPFMPSSTIDGLHTYVNVKKYYEWWEDINFPKK